MTYLAQLTQYLDGDVKLTVYRGNLRYSVELTPSQAQQLAHRLMSFAAAQQTQPFYLLDKELEK